MDNTRFSAVRKGQRGVFDLNKMHTSTTDFFRWDVVHCMPLVPNDSVNISLKSFIDSAPNPFPINGSCSYGMYAFYVPNRIVWDDWPNYIYSLQSDLTPPYFTCGDLRQAYQELLLSVPEADRSRFGKEIRNFLSNIDGFGCVVRWLEHQDFASISLKFSAMPLRMVQALWFDWMRDKNHISDSARSSYCLTMGGHISVQELKSLIHPKYRCWPKNYITTSFDSPQEGSAVVVPVALASSDVNPNFSQPHDGSRSNLQSVTYTNNESSVGPASSPLTPGYVDIGQFNINQLREKNSLVQFAERILVAGKTRVSRALALLGVSPTIEELQMADYIGGHEEELLFRTTTVGASTRVAQDSSILLPVGSFGYNPAGGTAAGQKFQNIVSPDNGFGLENIQYKTDEDGYIFIMGCLVPHPQYFEGLPRNWTRGLDTFASDVFDYFHQDFENQPLQPVLNYEVCFSPEFVRDPKGVFAFNQMYLDYKMSMDSIAGDFVSPYAIVGYENMHLGRDIGNLIDKLATSAGGEPQEYLTPEFLTQSSQFDQQLYDKKFTITSEIDHFIVNHKINVRANRPMQQVSLPSLDAALSAQTSKTLHETGGFRL